MSPVPKSAALIPYYGPGAHAHYEAVRLAALPAIASLEGFASVDAARSLLLETALMQTKAEVFVFIDSDIAFARSGYDALVKSASEQEAIVGGVYLTRFGLDGRQRLIGTPSFAPGQTIEFFERGHLYPASCVGMGFTAIPRAAVEKMVAFHQMQKCDFRVGNLTSIGYPLFQPMIHEGQYLLEDHAFCLRAAQAGIPIFADTRPKLVHYGEHGHLVSDLRLRSQHDPHFAVDTGPSPIQRLPPSSTSGWLGLEKP